MAKNPRENAERYGLSRSVIADMEDDEGPALGGQGGESRTLIPEHSQHIGHGPKTRQRAKDIINRH